MLMASIGKDVRDAHTCNVLLNCQASSTGSPVRRHRQNQLSAVEESLQTKWVYLYSTSKRVVN